jgi:hypothetical protein
MDNGLLAIRRSFPWGEKEQYGFRIQRRFKNFELFLDLRFGQHDHPIAYSGVNRPVKPG